jgi:PAS domain S-box-containing protein
VRGYTSDRVAGTEAQTPPAVADLVARAEQATTLVDVQELVAQVRALPGIRDAALRCGAGAGTDDPHEVSLPVAPGVRLSLWVHPDNVDAWQVTRPAAEELLLAARRTLTRACPALPADRFADFGSLYRAFLRGARSMIVVVDPEAGWAPLSDAFEAVLGPARPGRPGALLDLVHPEDRPAAVQAYVTACGGSHPAPLDLRLRTAAGSWRTIEVVVRSFVTDPVVRLVAFFALDVTEKRADELALRDERRRLATLVESLRDGVALLDGQGRVCVVNDAFQRLARLSGRPFNAGVDWSALLAALGPSIVDGKAAVDRLREAVAGPGGLAGEELTFPDGGVVEVDVVPVERDGRRGGTLVHARDVTTEVSVRRGLEARNQALAEASAMNTEFVATVAHELRGPLSSVVAFAHLLGDADSGPLSDDQRSYVDVIDRNANRLLRLIEDLLLLARLESRTLQLRLAPVHVNDLLEAAVSERQPVATAAGLQLDLDATDGPALLCDETRIHQLVGNLLGNAVKFTPAGGSVSVRARTLGETWQIDIADTGVGIPAGELRRVFSAFFRGSNVAAAVGRPGLPGTGLGLVVSRAIVELHGGTIQVASTEGVGTTVTVSLPTRPRTTDGGLT